MKTPSNSKPHSVCPADWKNTPDLTGSFELDAMIMRTQNKDMEDRLSGHLVGDEAYKQRTPYSNGSGVS